MKTKQHRKGLEKKEKSGAAGLRSLITGSIVDEVTLGIEFKAAAVLKRSTEHSSGAHEAILDRRYGLRLSFCDLFVSPVFKYRCTHHGRILFRQPEDALWKAGGKHSFFLCDLIQHWRLHILIKRKDNRAPTPIMIDEKIPRTLIQPAARTPDVRMIGYQVPVYAQKQLLEQVIGTIGRRMCQEEVFQRWSICSIQVVCIQHFSTLRQSC
jgi:hypothetical protein